MLPVRKCINFINNQKKKHLSDKIIYHIMYLGPETQHHN